MGSQNCSHVALEDFRERFALSPTVGKLVNIVPEIGDIGSLPEGKLKAFVGGDPMTVDRKYQEPLNVKPTARLVFATNKVPRFADKSQGIWRRLIILPATRVVQLQEQDPALAKRLCEELPGIFNWAVQGLVRLRKRGRFAEPAVSRTAQDAHRAASDPERAFLMSHLREDPQGSVLSAGVRADYCGWCEQHGHKPVGEGELGKTVRRVFPSATRKRQTEGSDRPYFYIGISPVPDVPEDTTVTNSQSEN